MGDAPGGIPPSAAADRSLVRAGPTASVQTVTLQSGSTITVRSDPGGDDIRLESAGGALELRIRMTPDGPVLSLRGARLEIEASDAVALTCREFSVQARDGVSLRSGGPVRVESGAEIRMRSSEQTYIDGDYVNLNCLDRTGYHDAPAGAASSPPPVEAGGDAAADPREPA